MLQPAQRAEDMISRTYAVAGHDTKSDGLRILGRGGGRLRRQFNQHRKRPKHVN